MALKGASISLFYEVYLSLGSFTGNLLPLVLPYIVGESIGFGGKLSLIAHPLKLYMRDKCLVVGNYIFSSGKWG